MSQSKDRHEAERWLETAREDLRAAHALQAADLYSHACFMAQQCGEKSIKALWYLIGHEPWGHSIQKLLMEYPEPHRISDLEEWQQRAAWLDKFYVPTRYPNGLPDLTPGQTYFAQDAEQAIDQATFFLDAAQHFLSPV